MNLYPEINQETGIKMSLLFPDARWRIREKYPEL